MKTLRKQLHHDQFRMQYLSDLPDTAVEWALQHRSEWVAQGPEKARVIVLTRVPDYPEPVVLKFHPTVHIRHFGHRTKGARLRQLFRRYAAKEVDAVLKLYNAGVATPAVLAWGERWRKGLRHEGLVITQFIASDDLECRLSKGDVAWLESAAKGLAALHNAGLVHCDTYPQNFFEHDNQLQMIDLESVTTLTKKDQLADMIGLFVPPWVQQNNRDAMDQAFAIYSEHCKHPPTAAEWEGVLEKGYKHIHQRWQTGLRSTRNSFVINLL